MEEIDLFEQYETLPKKVKKVIENFNDMGNTYTECENLLKALKPLGYTFEYGLSGEPFNLKKIDNIQGLWTCK